MSLCLRRKALLFDTEAAKNRLEITLSVTLDLKVMRRPEYFASVPLRRF